MTDRMTNSTTEGDVMAGVHEGMQVHDSQGKRLGKVDSVFMGARADSTRAGGELSIGTGPETTDNDSLIGDVGRAFDDSLPEVLRNRLRHNGYVRIRGGLFSGDRFALREHIASVAGDRVNLNIPAEALIGA
jgi:hypothetical protein